MSFDDGHLPLAGGTRLVHIGAPGTGTASLQAAFQAARASALAQGVRYAGTSSRSVQAVLAATGQPTTESDRATPSIGEWERLLREVREAREPRLVLSGDGFSSARPEAIARIVRDLDPARVHIAVTLQPLAGLLSHAWQDQVLDGRGAPLDAWLDGLFNRPSDKASLDFWHRHRHDQLIERWAGVVGSENVTVVIADDADDALVRRAFEQLTGLHEGTLAPDLDPASRPLTLPEIEGVRALFAALEDEGLNIPALRDLVRVQVAAQLRTRVPGPDEPPIRIPSWAHDRVGEVTREVAAAIALSGVRVVGSIDALMEVPDDQPAGARQAEVRITPDVAATMAMGVLVASGVARDTDGMPRTRAMRSFIRQPWPEPIELARVSTPQLAGILLDRARARLVRRVRRSLPGRRSG